MAYMNEQDQIGPRRKGLVDALAGGNTGITGGLGQPPPKLDAPTAAQAAPMADMAKAAATPPPAASAAPGPFQSGNASVSGYLQDAMNNFAPTIRGIADEAGRKKALNDYVTSLVPEVQKRGGNISDIHGDGANVDGRRIDFFGDVEGKAIPQYLDVTDQQNAPAQGGGMTALPSAANPIMQGDAGSNIQDALSGIGAASQSNILQQLIQQLQGGR